MHGVRGKERLIELANRLVGPIEIIRWSVDVDAINVAVMKIEETAHDLREELER